MPFRQATFSDGDRAALQRAIDSGVLPFPPPAIPETGGWTTPAADTAPLDFLWYYYLRVHGETRENIIATLKQALVTKTASGEHEVFFNF